MIYYSIHMNVERFVPDQYKLHFISYLVSSMLYDISNGLQ